MTALPPFPSCVGGRRMKATRSSSAMPSIVAAPAELHYHHTFTSRSRKTTTVFGPS